MTAKNPTLRLVGGSDVKPTAAAERLKRKPGRQSNPLRPKFLPISPAVTIFGKIQKSPEDLPELCTGVSERWLEVLRAGAEASRLVAVELDQAAELLAKVVPAKAAPSAEREQAYHDLLEAFGKLDPAGRRAVVSYLKTQA